MKYFTLNRSLNIKEIGDETHASKLTASQEYNVLAEYSFWNIMPFVDLGNIKIPEFVFNKRAKNNDLISIVGIKNIDLQISNKLLSLFEKFKLPDYQIRKLILERGTKVFHYNLLHFLEPCDGIIDFRNSHFELQQGRKKLEDITFQSFEDFEDKRKKEILKNEISNDLSCSFRPKKIIIDHTPKYDLFLFKSVNNLVFANENIVSTINRENITGIAPLPLKDYKKIEFVFPNIS